MADRVRAFKNQARDTEDARARRRDSSVELRKNKRVEQLMKKRCDDVDEEVSVEDQENVDVNATASNGLKRTCC